MVGVVGELTQISAIIVLCEARGLLQKRVAINPAVYEADLIRTAGLQALAVVQGAHEIARVQ